LESKISTTTCPLYILSPIKARIYINMKTISLVAAAVMLASSASAAGNDPRECEGKFLSCKKMPTRINY